MNAHRVHRLCAPLAIAVLAAMLVGCEGFSRKHDKRVVDIQPPPEDAPLVAEEPVELANFPDLVEGMMATREEYIRQLIELERAYLAAGDTVKGNWARRQRELTEAVEVYPYLMAGTLEHQREVSPEQQIPEADSLYQEALTLLNEVRGIPLAGHLSSNKKRVTQSLDLFRRVLREYPKSDKVDDCAFYCAEIYKEYLRDDDPDNELAIRYYRWAVALDPDTPHSPRFQCAVVYDFRRHDRTRALELYHQVLETEEDGNESNMRFAATRIEQLTDETRSHLRPQEPIRPIEPTASAEDAAENEITPVAVEGGDSRSPDDTGADTGP
jgi:tetratricopeptide (TPR) repeat protein